jgi:L-iditol 2-dehydrogenase
MRAAQYMAPGVVALVDRPEPSCGPGQALVCVERVGICGSDLHTLHDSPPELFPFLAGQSGHECVGTVVESRTPELEDGRRVLIIPPRADGLSERLAVEPQWLIPLPDWLEWDRAVLAQQLGTVVCCLRRIGSALGKIVVVIGQGPAGLMFSAMLSRMGARKVIGIDVVPHRLAVAQQLGADHTVDATAADPTAAVQELTRGAMADLVVEAVGKAETINLCAELARPEGELALFGVPKQGMFPFAYERFLRRQLRTVASIHAQGEPGLPSFRLAVDLLAREHIDVRPLISHRLPFSEVSTAFALAEQKHNQALKVLLDLRANAAVSDVRGDG